MKKYIERSAVMQKFAVYVKRSNNSDFALTPTWNEAVQIVEECPTVDAVPVVRCKDCKWFCTDGDNNGSCGWRSIPGGVSGEWFCADGERKGGDE